MNHRIAHIALTLVLLSPLAHGHAQRKTLFDGGMLLHTGYMRGHLSALNYEAKGMTYGIGGLLRFHLGQHLRVGTEGFVSTMSQMGNGSYVRTGFGGLLADAYWRVGRWLPFAGLTVGGGSTSTLLMFEGEATDWQPESRVVLHNQAFVFADPYVGVAFALNEAVHLNFRIDRMVPLSRIDMHTGIRCYVGFVFAH